MKQIILFLLVITYCSLTFGQSNNLQEGNLCFTKGDYVCAVENYTKATLSSDERQKKIAGDNLRIAEKCLELRHLADDAFSKSLYGKAKEYYQGIVNENPKDEYAKSRLKQVQDLLLTLDVSKKDISFSMAGGSDVVDVYTDAISFMIDSIPSWCTIAKQSKNFVVSSLENPFNLERTGTIKVSIGSKAIYVRVKQAAKQEITLSVSTNKLSFSSSGGISDRVYVYSNTTGFVVSLLPSWCSVQTFNGYFTIVCNENYSTSSRSDWFNVTAGSKQEKIYIKQSGAKKISSNTTSYSPVSKKVKKEKRYAYTNSSKSFGLILGYSQLAYKRYPYAEGVHLGLRIEPGFNNRFGFNTGLVFSAFLSNYNSLYGDLSSGSYGLNIPLHLEYKFNRSKKIKLIAYFGPGLNLLTSSSFLSTELPATLEFGGGFRSGHVQFNLGKSSYLGDFKSIGELGSNVRQFQNIVMSLSYMF